MRRRDLITAAVGALAATMLAGGVAWAAIPGPGDVYTACMLKNIGTVRLIDKSLPPSNYMSHCKPALEVEMSWNQKGQQGLQGIPGPPGQGGANGADGQPGAQGQPGQTGDKGDPGPAGADGVDGVSGWQRIVSEQVMVDGGSGATQVATCPSGKMVLGGGVQAGSGSIVQTSYPLEFQWAATVTNPSATTIGFIVYAICADV